MEKTTVFVFLALILTSCSISTATHGPITPNNRMISSDTCKRLTGKVGGVACNQNEIDFGIVTDVKGSNLHCCKPKNELTTIEGTCEIERKTGTWRVVNSTVLEGLNKKDNEKCVGREVKVTGYIEKPECDPGSQCYGGNFMNVKSMEYVN